MTNMIIKEHTRILRPSEYELLLTGIPKTRNKIKFKALMLTGLRYSELKWLHEHPENFQGEFIKMPSTKTYAKQKERFVRLNSRGQEVVEYFLEGSQLSNITNWSYNLKRWAEYVSLEPDGLGAKTSRKTWESWLVVTYPSSFAHIYLSQGHTESISLKYYLNIPFTNQEKEHIKKYTDGWI